MSYEKQSWQNATAPNPIPINANHLNHMEDGIDAALRKDGGTMTGDLILNGAPTQPNQAATKEYADTNIRFITINTGDGSQYGTEEYVCTINNFDADKYIILYMVTPTSDYNSDTLTNYVRCDLRFKVYDSVYSGDHHSVYMKITADGEIYCKRYTGSTLHNLSVSILLIPVSAEIIGG